MKLPIVRHTPRRRPPAHRARLSTGPKDGGEPHEPAVFSSVQAHELRFCCLLSGWDARCTSCPFDWFGFDPRAFRSRSRASRATAGFGLSARDVREAREALGLPPTGADAGERELKAAFRAAALRWHPDCSAEEGAEARFKAAVAAYELLLARAAPES